MNSNQYPQDQYNNQNQYSQNQELQYETRESNTQKLKAPGKPKNAKRFFCPTCGSATKVIYYALYPKGFQRAGGFRICIKCNKIFRLNIF